MARKFARTDHWEVQALYALQMLLRTGQGIPPPVGAVEEVEEGIKIIAENIRVGLMTENERQQADERLDREERWRKQWDEER